MSAFGRAGMLSVGLHVALVAGTCVGLGRSGAAGAVGAPTRIGKITQDVGVVMLAAPETKPAIAQPQAAPPRVPQPVATGQTLTEPPRLPRSVTGTLPAADVRPTAHSEPPPTPPGLSPV